MARLLIYCANSRSSHLDLLDSLSLCLSRRTPLCDDHFPVSREGPVETCLELSLLPNPGKSWLGDTWWTYWIELEHQLSFEDLSPVSWRMEVCLSYKPAHCFHSWRPKWVLKWNAHLQVLSSQFTTGNWENKYQRRRSFSVLSLFLSLPLPLFLPSFPLLVSLSLPPSFFPFLFLSSPPSGLSPLFFFHWTIINTMELYL